ncbi:hypothetical protein D8Y22_17230 [Salinadaptatus halalkaliphilus]|uniref:RnhA operon protein n=1 Tax=Salinadaptatus halalkaliphilus TaxID=2419781 RepID=A0A4S3TI11_9EURY|nr:hypothetical protein [Salinadaptatus halalkaliphilus]THE63566.1 hypothetical protein D8Y22_17230 [Salinadaptatus halalkaliphilus]
MTDATDETGGDESPSDGDESDDLPREVREEAERLTRLERTATDENEATAYLDRRQVLLSEHEFTARIRDDDGDDVLVLHPAEWHEDGVIRTGRIDDLSRAIEIPLEGTADPDDWDAVAERNDALASDVREAYGEVHGDNAETLATFASNHYAKPIESLTGPELSEFLTEYFVRNAWPSADQQAVIDESITHVYETTGEPVPDYRSQ